MFGDIAKLTARIAVYGAMAIAMVALLQNVIGSITIPENVDISTISSYISLVVTMGNHWTNGVFGAMLTEGFAILTMELTILLFKISTISWKLLSKIWS